MYLDFPETTGGLHVISCYAPTRAGERTFFQQLDSVLSSVPKGESYILLGDFNAHVGCRTDHNDVWSNVCGPHGYGVDNDAGRELLSFLSCHQATVCDTWYEKRNIYKQTWQHPKSKRWSCIDYVVMRQGDRRFCLDVAVRRGAICNTDHHLVCARIRL